jgi:hypothetical protein
MRPKKYVFFISDAGSSNQILHKILNENLNAEVFGHEPGLTLAKSLGIKARKFHEFNNIDEYNIYVFGSYLINSEQDKLLEILKTRNLKTVGVLDHWINFENRWASLQPSEIWVSDQLAYNLAKQFFPNSEIKLNINHYFKNIEREYSSLLDEKTEKGIGFLARRGIHN